MSPTDQETFVATVIRKAKLGSERRAAQVDTCSVFASALISVLDAYGVKAEAHTATFLFVPGTRPSWHHSVVKVGTLFFDSLGEFDQSIVRKRNRIHPKVQSRLDIRKDAVDEIEEEYRELHAFLVKVLGKAAVVVSSGMPYSPRPTRNAATQLRIKEHHP